jgi:uracil-DNA glycosylase
MKTAKLNRQINSCQKCSLRIGARHAVPGEGPANAKIMLIGQNPGAEEDKTGRPFIGRSGKYLTKVLQKNGLDRNQLFITSIVKHKSPNNRKPTPDEIAACLPYLVSQINLIKPKIIVLMGRTAWQTPQQPNITYIKTYHPSAAMRFTKIRRKFEEDIKTLKQIEKPHSKINAPQ